jgi:hypothetical protein
MSFATALTKRVKQAATLIQRFTFEELRQLAALVPELELAEREKQLTEAAQAYYHRELEQLQEAYPPLGDDESFVGGLTVSEYFALPEEEQERLWNAEFAMDIDDFEEHEVHPDAHIPARQKRRA